jgi:type IV pilus assembly protein PilC
MYPAIILVICLLVTLFLLTFVIPTFKEVFDSFGAELPKPTLVVLFLSDAVRGWWYLCVGVPVAAYFGLARLYRNPDFRLKVDRGALRVPVFGLLLAKVAVARFARTFGTLLKAGVPILQALEAVSATAGNAAISRALSSARESVAQGGRLSEPLTRSGLFPEMVTQMITVGEETGALDQMLAKIADFYDSEVDAAVKGLTSIIEPLVIVVMGVIVGALTIAMFLPIIDVTKGIQ